MFCKVSVLNLIVVVISLATDITLGELSHGGSLEFEEHFEQMMRYINSTADPCEDFYEYACGNWAKYNPIPAGEAEYGVLDVMTKAVDMKLKGLLEASNDDDANSESAISKVKQFYASCMNEEALDETGLDILLSALESIGEWPLLTSRWRKEKFDLAAYIAKMHLKGVNMLFGIEVYPRLDIPDDQILYVKQIGVGVVQFAATQLDTTANNRGVRIVAVYIRNVLMAIGVPPQRATGAAVAAVRFMQLLESIKIQQTNFMTNWMNWYEPFSVADMGQLVHSFNFTRYLEIIFESEEKLPSHIALFPKLYIQRLDQLLLITSPRDIANYMMAMFLIEFASDGSRQLAVSSQNLMSVIAGVTTVRPRWKICVSTTKQLLWEPLSAMYIREHFDKASQQDVQEMINEFSNIFKEKVSSSEWFDEATRFSAITKLQKIEKNVGFPGYLLNDTVIDEVLKNVSFSLIGYLENKLKILEHNRINDLKEVFRPVDRSKFNLSPIVANAGYEFAKNRILVTAAILQSPIYNRTYPRYLNLGGIGIFIGHEIFHAFDSVGSNFNHDGKKGKLWSNITFENYEAVARCFKEKYRDYNVNEILTANENYADNGGLQAAYEALRRWLKSADMRDHDSYSQYGWTTEQLFFLSYTQNWCHASTPELEAFRLIIDPHSPARVRMIGAMSNFEEFSRHFNCTRPSGMNPEKRCRVW